MTTTDTVPISVPTDRWGEPIDLPEDLLRRETDGTYAVGCWSWPDEAWCGPHGCCCDGVRWAPDTPDVRAAHPNGGVVWQPAEGCHGSTPHAHLGRAGR